MIYEAVWRDHLIEKLDCSQCHKKDIDCLRGIIPDYRFHPHKYKSIPICQKCYNKMIEKMEGKDMGAKKLLKDIINLLEYLSSHEMDAHYKGGTQAKTERCIKFLKSIKP